MTVSYWIWGLSKLIYALNLVGEMNVLVMRKDLDSNLENLTVWEKLFYF